MNEVKLPPAQGSAAFSEGDVVVGRRNQTLAGRYWGALTVVTVAGKFVKVRGVPSWSKAPRSEIVTAEALAAFGKKVQPNTEVRHGA